MWSFLDQDTVNRITTILEKMEYTRNTAHIYMDSIKDRQRDIARLRKELGVWQYITYIYLKYM